jgi:hypothetical protein
MFGEGDESPGEGEVCDTKDAQEEEGATAEGSAAGRWKREGEQGGRAQERAQAGHAEGGDARIELDFDEEERRSPDDGEQEQGCQVAG